MDDSVLDWLLAGDAAIRWQVLSDLEGADSIVVDAERQRVAETGWGAQLLALQEPSGRWGGGLYSPKWISTHYTLLTLRLLGLPPRNPQAQRACTLLLESGFYQDGGINYFKKTLKHSETCITGMLLGMLSHFHFEDERLEHIAAHLARQQMADGGWNCESYRGATHGSFHTTLSVLEGLEEYMRFRGEAAKGGELINMIDRAQEKGREFLLMHHLFRSHRTGEVVDERMLRFPFPPRWRYDVLRALDYFRAASIREAEALRDERLFEAIEVIKKKQLPDGRWPAHAGMSGRIYFELENAGQPGRWSTLRALRVLNWWEVGA
jgi:hypothetical protein